MKIKYLFFLLPVFLTQSVFSADADNLFSAAILGKSDRVKSILADGIDVNGRTATGRTAIMGACFNGNVRVARVLLAYGADVNLADNQGSTAIMDAVIYGREQLVKLLITAGANVNAVDKQNVSVIEKAKKTHNDNIIKILETIIAEQGEAVPDDSAEKSTTDTKEQQAENKEE
ncbi:MAG: ankyrin repeat domain-containing protein [Methylococcaceae bacterium]|nr:ankyrin repeat domain-containing protein [Methylococcaceae bacterium]